MNVNVINRDTKNALNELGKIFDKKKLEERQELAKLFAKNANEAIYKISESKGWEDGSKEKIVLHTLVSSITAQLGRQSFADGAIAGGINEAVVGKLMDAIGKDNPDMVQIASAVLGYATNKLTGKDGEAGAAVAQWGTKWNSIRDYYYQIGNVIIPKISWINDAIDNALGEGMETTNEITTINLGNGDLIKINSGHGYYRMHKSQKQLGLPPLSDTPRGRILAGIISHVLTSYADGRILDGDVHYEHYREVLIGYEGEPVYVKMEISLRYYDGTLRVSDFYPIGV